MENLVLELIEKNNRVKELLDILDAQIYKVASTIAPLLYKLAVLKNGHGYGYIGNLEKHCILNTMFSDDFVVIEWEESWNDGEIDEGTLNFPALCLYDSNALKEYCEKIEEQIQIEIRERKSAIEYII